MLVGIFIDAHKSGFPLLSNNGTITNTLNISTQNLTTGLYVVEIIENNSKANYKLIVE